MIQDIKPHVFYNEYKCEKIKDHDYILSYRKDYVYVKHRTEEWILPTYKEVKHQLVETECQYLFEVDQKRFFLARKPLREEKEFRYIDNRTYRWMQPMHQAFACGVGEHLNRWYEDNKFCGSCGQLLVVSGKERALHCPSCKRMIYPTISPSVIVAIIDGERLLMTRYARGNYRNYALVAGYTEIGETIEETVHREVLEEVGLKVKNLRYYKSQPWPFSGAILMGFFAELDGDDNITLQEEELSEAVWFQRNEIPINSSKLSLTNEMIEVFRLGKERVYS